MMKIVQTCWLGNSSCKSPWQYAGGWISPEYHWMSWALSCLQLRCFYVEVELYANEEAIEILINKLNLPYTKSHIIPEDFKVPKGAWALPKLYTYSQQKEPFLHVDGDVFIWDSFGEAIENKALVAQNIEIGFSFYNQLLDHYKSLFDYLPDTFIRIEKWGGYSCNAGVLGGNNILFFKEYYNEAVQLVMKNERHLENIDSTLFCMVFEQLLFYRLAEEKELKINYLIKDGISDPTYPNFGRLDEPPLERKFVHAMGSFKKNSITYRFLAKRLRKDYPIFYYRILSYCQREGIELNNKAYGIDELSPARYDNEYFQGLCTSFIKNKLNNNTPHYYYAKDILRYNQSELIFNQNKGRIMNTILTFDDDCEVIEVYKPVLSQQLSVYDCNVLAQNRVELDNLNMILIDTLSKPKSIRHIIRNIGLYFNENKSIKIFPELESIVLKRVKDLLVMGALKPIVDEMLP